MKLAANPYFGLHHDSSWKTRVRKSRGERAECLLEEMRSKNTFEKEDPPFQADKESEIEPQCVYL